MTSRLGATSLGVGAMLAGVERDIGEAWLQPRQVLLRVMVENENLCRHEGS